MLVHGALFPFPGCQGLSQAPLRSYHFLSPGCLGTGSPPPVPHSWVFFAVILCYTGTANIFFPDDTYFNFDQRSLGESPAGLTARAICSRLFNSEFPLVKLNLQNPNSHLSGRHALVPREALSHSAPLWPLLRECICQREAELGTAL